MSERLSRVKVVEHAADLADNIGFNELTITKLGRSLGIAPPGVYRHVNDLGDLQREVSRLAAREIANELSIACAGLSGKAALDSLGTAMRTWAGEHPGCYTALQIAPEPDDVEGQVASGPVVDVMGATLRAYNLEGDDLTDAIRIVRSALHGFISLELNGGFKQPRSVNATFQQLITALDTALKHWHWH